MRTTFAVLLLTLAGAGLAAADEGCVDFKWDVTQERALFSASPAALTAGSDVKGAPAVTPGHAYHVKLSAQHGVSFAATPQKNPGDRPSFAGLVSLKVAASGEYRVSLDTPLWIDVVAGTTLLSPTDFQGQHSCSAPHKIVVFALEAGKRYWVQLSNSTEDTVTVALTAAPERKL
jgi:hypothetical protein